MMSNTLTVLLFFVYCWGLGFTLTNLFKLKIGDTFERHLMNIGFGLALIPVIGCLLNLIHVPIKWWIFLILSVVYPIYSGISRLRAKPLPDINPKVKGMFLSTSTMFLIGVMLMYGVMSYVYISGATSYPYLEDGDAYRHIAESYRISETGSFSWDSNKPYVLGVEQPYPSGYHILMGTLFQTASSWQWTIKVFNSLVIALGLVFFYFFVSKWTKSPAIGFFSTFCLFVIPSFMTHFIWTTSLSLPLFFPAFYALESIAENKKWSWVAGISIASIMVTQVSTAIFFGIFFVVYMIAKTMIEKNNRIFVAGVIGVLLSFGIFYAPAYFQVGSQNFLENFGIAKGSSSPLISGVHSGGEYVYTLKDFISAPVYGKIDNSIGIGPFLTLLFIVGLLFVLFDMRGLFKKKDVWAPIAIIWLIIGFAAVMAGRLPYSLFPHRSWAIMAIPLCIIAGSGAYYLWSYLHKTKLNPTIFIIIFLVLILATSGYSKYKINTSGWGWGAGIPQNKETMQGYVYLKQLPLGEKVFPLCSPMYLPIAFDKGINWYDEEIIYKSYFDKALNNNLYGDIQLRYNAETRLLFDNPKDVHLWLKKNNFKYAIIDLNCYTRLGNDTEVVFANWMQTGLFEMKFENGAFFLLGVK